MIIHHDLPIDLGEKDLRIYLQILRDAAKDWKPEENHELIVVFLSKYRETIRGLLNIREDTKE